MNVKQVIVIRKDLKMRRGKEIAQGSHSSMAHLTHRLISLVNKYNGVKSDDVGNLIRSNFTDAEWEWMDGSFAKVTLQVESEQELRDIYEKAKAAGLEAHLIIDSGRTEFNGVPTATAVGIGPDEADKINMVTGGLKLY
jgi:PTH2 family peptidyl-tRNA hydrolase